VNLATYLDCIVLENSSPAWPAILTQFDIFFRRLLLMMSSNVFEMDSVLKMMIGVLKIPGLPAAKVSSLPVTLSFIYNLCFCVCDGLCILPYIYGLFVVCLFSGNFGSILQAVELHSTELHISSAAVNGHLFFVWSSSHKGHICCFYSYQCSVELHT